MRINKQNLFKIIYIVFSLCIIFLTAYFFGGEYALITFLTCLVLGVIVTDFYKLQLFLGFLNSYYLVILTFVILLIIFFIYSTDFSVLAALMVGIMGFFATLYTNERNIKAINDAELFNDKILLIAYLMENNNRINFTNKYIPEDEDDYRKNFALFKYILLCKNKKNSIFSLTFQKTNNKYMEMVKDLQDINNFPIFDKKNELLIWNTFLDEVFNINVKEDNIYDNKVYRNDFKINLKNLDTIDDLKTSNSETVIFQYDEIRNYFLNSNNENYNSFKKDYLDLYDSFSIKVIEFNNIFKNELQDVWGEFNS